MNDETSRGGAQFEGDAIRAVDGRKTSDIPQGDTARSSVTRSFLHATAAGRLLSYAVSRLRSRVFRAERDHAIEEARRGVTVLDAVPLGLYVLDSHGHVLLANRRFATMYGFDDDDVRPGRHVSHLLLRRREMGTARVEDDGPDLPRLPIGNETRQVIERLLDGRIIDVTVVPTAERGSIVIHQDVTVRHRATAHIEFLAHHDGLTGLPNRVDFHRRLAASVGRATGNARAALLSIDLDHFKAINDNYGHAAGDALLVAVAERLRGALDSHGFAARLGGDEFAVVFDAFTDTDQARHVARLLEDSLAAPHHIDGHEIATSVSIGIAIAPDDADDVEQLSKCADMALYRAKQDGRGTHRFFERDFERQTHARLELESDLRHAVDRGELELHYQPLFALSNERIVGFEALLRWNHPTRGRIAPAEFIPLAEETGLIGAIGAWVLKEACREATAWPDGLTVSVNVSPVQFRGPRLLLDVVAALGSSGIDARRLEIEVTEAVLLPDDGTTLEIFESLRRMGIGVALDDFGAGYSSLGYLRRFPFDKVKIDRSFVQDHDQDGHGRAIVRAITRLCAELDITATAEGVETAAQLESLWMDGCEFVQGFHLGRPVPARDLKALLQDSRNVADAPFKEPSVHCRKIDS